MLYVRMVHIYKQYRGGIMSFLQKFKDIISPEDEIIELSDNEVESMSEYESPREKGISSVSGDIKMVIFEPRTFDEAEDIAEHLKNRRAAVVNLHRLHRDYAQRCIDFLTGVVFALDGKIQKVGHNVILCTPKSIAVGGEINLEDLSE